MGRSSADSVQYMPVLSVAYIVKPIKIKVMYLLYTII